MYIMYESIILTAIFLAIWKCAQAELFFAFRSRNQVSMIESGAKPDKLIGAPPKGWCIDGFSIKTGTQKYHLWEKWFQMFYIGLTWKQVKEFFLIHERMNEEITADTPPSQWIVRDALGKPERFLLVNSLHDFFVPGVVLAKGYVMNILVQVELMLEEPLVALYDRSGSQPHENDIYKVDFYGPIGDIVKTAVENACKGMGYGPEIEMATFVEAVRVARENFPNATDPELIKIVTDMQNSNKKEPAEKEMLQAGFLAADKSSTGPICVAILTEIQRTIVKLSGYGAICVFMPRWALTSDEQRNLVQEREKATIKRDVANLTAESENAETIVLMKAMKERFPTASDSELSQRVTELEISKNISKMGNLTVYAPGGNLAVGTSPTNPNKGKGK
jgi:hypothetical protein